MASRRRKRAGLEGEAGAEVPARVEGAGEAAADRVEVDGEEEEEEEEAKEVGVGRERVPLSRVDR